MKIINGEYAENICNSLGVEPTDKVLQLIVDIQAHTLYNFAEWCRKGTGNMSWNDVAICAELEAAEWLSSITI